MRCKKTARSSTYPSPKSQASVVYASEPDLLNVALFGQTVKQWREANPGAEGNVRDHAPLEQLVVLTNLESLNSDSHPLHFSVSVFKISSLPPHAR